MFFFFLFENYLFQRMEYIHIYKIIIKNANYTFNFVAE